MASMSQTVTVYHEGIPSLRVFSMAILSLFVTNGEHKKIMGWFSVSTIGKLWNITMIGKSTISMGHVQ